MIKFKGYGKTDWTGFEFDNCYGTWQVTEQFTESHLKRDNAWNAMLIVPNEHGIQDECDIYEEWQFVALELMQMQAESEDANG